MNANESHLKDRLGNEALADPAGQAAMWEAIEGQLHSGTSKPVAGWWMFGALAFVLGAGFTWFYLAPSDALLAEDLRGDFTQVQLEPMSQFAGTSSTPYALHVNSNTENTTPAFTGRQESNSTRPTPQTRAYTPNPDALQQAATGIPSNNSNPASSRSTQQPTPTPLASGSAPSPEPVHVSAFTATPTPSPTEVYKAVSEPINTDPAPRFFSELQKGYPGLLTPIQPAFENLETATFKTFQNEATLPGPYSISMYAGPNMSRLYITGGHSETQDQFQTADLGFSVGVALNRRINTFSQISAGLEWHNYWSHFELERYTTSIDSLPNQIVEYIINGGTGDTVEVVYGTAAVTSVEHRRIIHHNRYSTLGIPFEYSAELNLGQLRAGLGIGAVIHVRTNSIGRGLNAAGEIITYTKEDAPQAAISLSPRIRPYIAYPINERLQFDLSASMGVQRQFATEVKSRMHFYHFRVGLTRHF